MILRLPWPAQTPSGDVLDFLAYSSPSGRLKPVNQNHLVFIDERALVGLPNYTLEASLPSSARSILGPGGSTTTWTNVQRKGCGTNARGLVDDMPGWMDGWMDIVPSTMRNNITAGW